MVATGGPLIFRFAKKFAKQYFLLILYEIGHWSLLLEPIDPGADMVICSDMDHDWDRGFGWQTWDTSSQLSPNLFSKQSPLYSK